MSYIIKGMRAARLSSPLYFTRCRSFYFFHGEIGFGLPVFGGEGSAAGGADFPGAGGHGFSLGFSSLGSGRAGSGSSGGDAGAITSMPTG